MRVLIADDQEMLRELFDAMLSRDGVAVSLADCLEAALAIVEDNAAFDLILLDYNMPGMNGVDGIRRTLEQGKGAPVALMSGNLPQHIVHDALQAGAVGFLPKKLPPKSYLEAIRAMAAGQTVNLLDDRPSDTASVPPASGGQVLTSREALVLKHLATGKLAAEIAAELDLKSVTVNFVVKTLCRKFDVATADDAVAHARKAGLL